MNSEDHDIIIYQNNDGSIKLDVQLQDETVWISQTQMGQLFGKDKRTIREHINNVFKEGELEEQATVRNFRTVRNVNLDLYSVVAKFATTANIK